MAVYTSLFTLGLMYVFVRQDMMDMTGFMYSAAAMFVCFALFAGVFLSGLNLKAADPSLTALQMACSVIVMTFAMFYCSSDARGVLLLIFLVSFLFGVLRLQTRELFFVGLVASFCYGAMISALMNVRPVAINLPLELLRWFVMSAVLTWFALIGGYLSRVRKQLSDNNTELKNALQTIQDLATHDALTGIHNRRYLEEVMRQEQSRSSRYNTPLCVCLVDIDLFKSINDSLGHQGGDEVLKGFSSNAIRGVRQSDHFGRYGGEEFLAILTETELRGAITWADHLRDETKNLGFSGLSPDFRMTISIGIAQYHPGEDIEKTVSRADKALYVAKAAGRNRVEAEDLTLA